MTVGERIKELREKKSISQTELAEKVNISKQTLYKYENNIVTNIPSDNIEAIADVLHTSPSYLMGWTDINKEEYIIEKYNQLTQDNKKVLEAYLEFLLEKDKKDVK